MSDEIFLDGARFVSALDAARSADLSRDYITRLCKRGEVRGRLFGKSWYVEDGNFKEFLVRREFEKTKHREELSRTREVEYARQSIFPLGPKSGSYTPRKVFGQEVVSSREGSFDVRAALTHSLQMHAARAASKTPHVAFHTPLYTVTPFVDFLHKAVALITAFMLTFGTYAFVDPSYAREVGGAFARVGASVASIDFERVVRDTEIVLARAIERPETVLAAAGSATGDTFNAFHQTASRFNTFVNSVAYRIAFPTAFVWERTVFKSPVVALTITERAPAVTANATSPRSYVQTSITRVVERIIEPQVVTSQSGISEALLSGRLSELESRINARFSAMSSANSTFVTGNSNAMLIASRNIENIGDSNITNSRWTGGTITNAAISALSLQVTGTATSTFAGGINLTSGCFAVGGTCITGGGTPGGSDTEVQFNNAGSFAGDSALTFSSSTDRLTVTNASTTNFTATNATSTAFFATYASTTNSTSTNLYSSALVAGNATSTNLYSSVLVAGNATSTNFFSTLARFTTGVIDTLTATVATITNLTATTFTTTNATTTRIDALNYLAVGRTATTTIRGDGIASTIPYASTTALTVSGTSGFQLATGLDGPLQANAGLVSATTSVGTVYGGTGVTSYTTGDILYASAANTLSKLSVGSTGQVLKVSGGLPSWGADATGSGGAGAFSTTSDSLAIYPTDTSDVLIIGASATSTTGNILEVLGASLFRGALTAYNTITAPSFTATSTTVASQLPYASSTAITVSGTASTSALIASNSFTFSNVTGFLKATAGAVATSLINLASDVTGILPVANGGTGWSTITSSTLLTGNGSGALATTTIGNGLTLSGAVLSTSFGTTTANTWTALQSFSAGASTTRLSVFGTSYFGGSATSTFSSAGVLNLAGLASAVLGVDTSGNVVATTSIGTNYLTGTLGTVNGTTFGRGDSITITAASSTLLANNNTFSGTNAFGNTTLTNGTSTSFAVTNITSAIPLANADGSFAEYAGTSCTNQFVRSINGAGVATCASVSLTADVTGTLAVANGGTGWSTIASNTLLTGNGSGALATTTIGNGLTLSGAILSTSFGTTTANTWTALQSFSAGASTTQLSVFNRAYFGGTSTTTIDSTGAITVTSNTASVFPYASSTALTVSGTGFFGTASTTNLTVSGIPSALLVTNSSGVAAAYAGTSCTNQFVRSINGSGVATCASVSLTADVTGTLAVANGGTGWANVQAGGILYGNGTGALATTTQGTGGQILAWSNGIPSWVATTTFSSGLTYANGNVTNTGVTSLTGTANQITASGSTGAITLSFPSLLFLTQASSTQQSVLDGLYVGRTATTTILGSATSTFGAGIQTTYLNVTGTAATSTFARGIELAGGCFAINGTCVGGGAGSGDITAVGSMTSGDAFADSTADDDWLGLGASAGRIEFDDLTVDEVNILSASVGIGTSTPYSRLSVWGTSTGNIFESITSASSSALTVSGTGFGTTTVTGLTISGSATSTSNVGWNLTGGCFSISGTCVGGASLTGTTGQMAYFSGTNSAVGTSTLFVSTGSNVGIGTSSPYAKLTVWGAGTGTGTLFELANSASTTIAKFLDNGTGYFLGNIGIGTTSPYRKLSLTDAVSTAQVSIAYDSTRYTELLTSSVGDLTINPQGDDVFLNDDNLWVCVSSVCPTGTPLGNGTLVVGNRIGVGTTTAAEKFAIQTSDATTDFLRIASSTAQSLLIFDERGYLGIGTSTPSQQLSIANKLFVANGTPASAGTATSTFLGDVLITGKLDVSTIDPVYTIDGVKYATYGHSTVGVKEELAMLVEASTRNAEGKYEYVIDFKALPLGSDPWLFWQVSDFGASWENLIVSLTPGFDGQVSYVKDAQAGTLRVVASHPGEVSLRLIADRFDSASWPTLRPDQGEGFKGFELKSKN